MCGSFRSICSLAVLVVLSWTAGAAMAGADLRERLAQLRGQAVPAVSGVRLASAGVLDDFYRYRGYRFAWSHSDQVRDLVRLIEESVDHGLRPGDFHAGQVRAIARRGGPGRLSASRRVDAELLLSDSLLRLIHHLRYGKVDPTAVDSKWNHVDGPYSNELAGDLVVALGGRDLAPRMERLVVAPAFYERLKRGLAAYRRIAAEGGWPLVPEGPKLEPGVRDGRIPAVRERLRVTGELSGPEPLDPRYYDADLESAVRAFQERHNLGVDGIIGPATLAAMNVSARQRVDQIRVNLERMRWVMDGLPDDFLLVDIAGQRVQLFKDGEERWGSRIIVGRKDRPTPVFRDQVEYLELNPTWTVPPTILKEDILPKARKDPDAVRQKGLQVIARDGSLVAPEAVNWHVSPGRFPYTLRQPPGSANALGSVKFMFPNRYSVYLHDTPDRHLFARPQRLYSSGCVRVERPFELAELLLDDAGWSRERLEEKVGARRPSILRLSRPIPILLSYWTAEAGEDGQVRFREDVYGRDLAVLVALDGTGPVRLVHVDAPPRVGEARVASEPAAPRAQRVGGGTSDLPGEGPLFSF